MFSDAVAEDLFNELIASKRCLVLAESCTAGLIAASLGRISGVSKVLAGSAVVYQWETKTEWLEVPYLTLVNFGDVNPIVSEAMALGVLRKTPDATISASVTGHLGPLAPPEFDGIAWTSIAYRTSSDPQRVSRKLDLDPRAEAVAADSDELEVRRQRQFSAAEQVMKFCIETLKELPPFQPVLRSVNS